MKKEKLLELYEELKKHQIKESTLRQLRNCNDEEIEIIINSKYPKVMMKLLINYEFKLLKENDQKEIIDIINTSKNEKTALGIYQIVISRIILSSGLTMELVNIINDSNKEISKYLIDLTLTTSFLTNPNSLEIMKIIGTCKTEYQAKIISDIVKSIEVLLNENILEIIKIVIKEENELKLNLMNVIAKNRNVLSTNLSVKILTLINKINTEDIEYIISIANDKILEKNNRTIIYLEKILISSENIKNIYNEAQLEISLSEQRTQRTKKDPDVFWNIYKESSIEAIELLKESDKETINPNTRIRKKQ